MANSSEQTVHPLTMRAASCFSGIGAPEMGAPHFDWLWCAEVEPFPCEVLAARHPESTNLSDVTADDFIARAKAFGPLDLLVGGPPCQAFSVAGLRQSLADHRGNLSLRFLEIAHAIRPRNLLVENVPGWLNTDDNAFGCFLGGLVGADDALPAPDGGSWPSAGMVAGPRARAAWRVLDAQYFGVAQRRRRVFLVADFGDGADPAAVLFERQGLLGNPTPRRETGQGTAGTLSARTEGGGGLGTDFELGGGLQPVIADIAATLPAGGNSTGGDRPPGMGQETADTMLVASAVPFSIMPQNSGKDYKARQVEVPQPLMAGGPVGGNQGGDVIAQPIAFPERLSATQYASSENLSPSLGAINPMAVAYPPEIAGTLKSCGGKSGLPNGAEECDRMIPVAIQAGALRENPNSGPDGVGVQEGLAYTLEARAEVQAVAFAQNQRDEVRQMDIAGALAAEPGMKQQTYVAQEPYTLAERGREGGANLEYRNDGTSNTILTPSGGRGGIGVGAIATAWQVRRLTVKECERLQGFPDGFTLIETTKRRTVEADMGEYLADQGAIVTTGNDGKIRTNAAADGPRYKALGNSWAVPCGAWILARLERELQAMTVKDRAA